MQSKCTICMTLWMKASANVVPCKRECEDDSRHCDHLKISEYDADDTEDEDVDVGE